MAARQHSELQQTELGKIAVKVVPVFEEYGKRILAGLAAVLLIVAIVIFWTRSSRATLADGWNQMAAARTAEDYANLADRFAGTQVGVWARLAQADSHLSSGTELSFKDRKASHSELTESRKAYELLLNDSLIDTRIHEKALFGMARALEAVCDGSDDDMTEAIGAYERLLTYFPDTIYRDLAERRIASLNSAATREFYVWYHEQDPKPEDISRPSDGLPDAHLPVPSGERPVRLPSAFDLLDTLRTGTPDNDADTPNENAAPDSAPQDQAPRDDASEGSAPPAELDTPPVLPDPGPSEATDGATDADGPTSPDAAANKAPQDPASDSDK